MSNKDNIKVKNKLTKYTTKRHYIFLCKEEATIRSEEIKNILVKALLRDKTFPKSLDRLEKPPIIKIQGGKDG